MTYRWRALIAIGLVAALSLAARHLHIDDALIYARYVRNLLTGHGLVFNWGERVNALTSPLHTLLMVVLSWALGGRILLAGWLLGAAFLAATALLAERVVPFSGMAIAGLIYFEIFLGMETCLFIFLLLLSAVLYAEEKWDWLPTVLCLTALTRFEGALLVLAVAWQLKRRGIWPRWQAMAPAFALLALYLWGNHHLYGEWLPSSGRAKLLQGLSGYWGRWPTAFFHMPRAFYWPLRSLSYLIPVSLWLAWRGMKAPQCRRWNAIVLPFLAVLLAFCTLANVTGYLWYYAPFVLFIMIYAAAGMPHTRAAYALFALVIAHGTLLGCKLLTGAPAMYEHYRYLCRYLNANAPPGATVAAMETGTVGWYCDRPSEISIIDIVGLTTPQNAEYLAHHEPARWLEEEKPYYVVVHTGPGIGETAVVSSPNYERLPVALGDTYLMRRKPDRNSVLSR